MPRGRAESEWCTSLVAEWRRTRATRTPLRRSPARTSYGALYKPKRGEQLEAGVKWSPADGRYSLAAAAYDLDEKNRLTIDPDNPLNQIQRGEVSVQGVELEATANLRAWDLVASYAYTDGTVSASSDPADPYLGKRLHSIPAHSAALWTVRRFSVKGLGRLSAGMGVRYVGETWDGADTLATPSTTLFDALFSVDRDRWRYAVNASNLFDKTLHRHVPRARRLLVRQSAEGVRDADLSPVARPRSCRRRWAERTIETRG